MATQQRSATREGEPVPKPELDLATIAEEELLELRLSELPLRIEGTFLQACVAQLHEEIAARSIPFAPRCYLADEWLTPEGEPVIGIPFYLAHPRLIRLQKKMLLEAEGDNHDWCMRLLRHEAGHALTYAYGLNRRRSWQRVFGHPSAPYEDTYKFRPYSKSYVHHLDHYYAQYHPDEDFCETFAVWLAPASDWRRKYVGWKALAKLEYVDQLMSAIAGKAPRRATGRQFYRIASIRMKLRRYYQKRREVEAEDFPEFHDENLLGMFGRGEPGAESPRTVAAILKSHRKSLVSTISNWSGQRRFMVNRVYEAVLERSRALQLATEEPDTVAVLKLASYLTTLMMNYRYTTRLRGEI